MPLNIKNDEVERLAAEVARLTGESKTEAIRQALLARRAQLGDPPRGSSRGRRLALFLERRVWPHVPSAVSARPLTKAEREKILGYGPGGV
jgi:antitoxin VapB